MNPDNNQQNTGVFHETVRVSSVSSESVFDPPQEISVRHEGNCFKTAESRAQLTQPKKQTRHAAKPAPETFLPTQEELHPTDRATFPSRRWRRWRWTSRSLRRRHPATRARGQRRGGAAEGRGCGSTTCSTSTTFSSRSGRRRTTLTALRLSGTTLTPEVSSHARFHKP